MTDQPQPTPIPVSVFYSYAENDEALCKELENHLSLLQRQALITGWHDRKLVAGTSRTQTIDRELNKASIILLLISADFLASDYRYSVEMKRAMERHEAKEARVIPIILRPVDLTEAPFAPLQALPTDGYPVTDDKHWSTQDHAFEDVAKGIRQVVYELSILDKARSHLVAGDYEEALEVYDKLLQLYPHSAVAYAGKGDALSHLKRYQEAVNAYDQARELDRTISGSENEYGSAMLAVKRYEEALSAFDRAIKINSDLASAHSGKGNVLFQVHRYEEALEAYNEALRLSPNDASKGYTLEQLAQQAFEKAKQLGYSKEMQMQSLPINVEKLTLLQTIPIPYRKSGRMLSWVDPNGPKLVVDPNALPLTAMAASPDGKFLAGAHLDSTKHRQVKFGATLWDLNTGKVVKTIGEFQGKVSCLCFSPDGQTLLSSEQSDEQAHHVVQAWDVKTGELTQTFPSHPYRPSAISTDGRVLIGIGANDATEYALIDSEQRTFSPGYRRKLIVASLSTGKRLSQFPLDEIGMENFSITAIATISNEGLIVLGCRRKSQGSFSAILNLLDGSTGRLLHTIGDMYTPLTALAIHTDEHIFASGYENGTIKLWNLSTAQLLSTFVGHESTVSALAFSMDGHQVVSASADGTIKIWGNT